MNPEELTEFEARIYESLLSMQPEFERRFHDATLGDLDHPAELTGLLPLIDSEETHQ